MLAYFKLSSRCLEMCSNTVFRLRFNFPSCPLHSLTSVKVLNSIIFLGKATQYVKQKQDLEVANARQDNLASSRILKAQESVTMLDSTQSYSASLVGERRDIGPGGAGEHTKKPAKTLAEIDRYTLCNKEIVVF